MKKIQMGNRKENILLQTADWDTSFIKTIAIYQYSAEVIENTENSILQMVISVHTQSSIMTV